MTTIVSVRRNGHVVIAGDGQATLGNTVMKGNVKKVRRLYNDKVIAGFAGGTADAFTLFELAGDTFFVSLHAEPVRRGKGRFFMQFTGKAGRGIR